MKRKALLLIIPFAAAALTGCKQNVKPCSDANITFQSTINVDVDEKTKIPYTIEGGTCSGELNFTFSKQGIVEITFENGAYYVKGLAEGEVDVTCNGKSTFTVVVGGETPEPGKEVVEVLSVKSVPATIEVDEELDPSMVILNVKLSDGTQSTAKATRIELDTSEEGETQGTAWYRTVGSADFDIEVVAAAEKLTPAEVIELCDEAGSGVVVNREVVVVGEVEDGATKDSNGWSGKFKDSNLYFESSRTNDPRTSLNGCTITLKGYAELYNNKYKIGYLPANVSPTGQKYNPSILSIKEAEGKEIVEVVSVKSAPTSVVKDGTINPAQVTLNVKLADGTPSTVTATDVECNTSTIADNVTAKAYYNDVGFATFTINVVDGGTTQHAGTESDPYTPSDAAIVAAGLEQTTDSKNPIATDKQYYIKGTVSKLAESFDVQYGSYSFWLGNDEFEVWRIKNGENKDKFNEGDIAPGDEVTIKAKIMNFKGTPENTTDAYVVSVNRGGEEKEVTGITAVSYTKTLYVNGTINPADVTLTVSYSDGTSGTVKAQSVDGYSTEEAGNTTATAHYGTFTKDFDVEVKTKPAPTGEGSVYTFTNDKTSSQNMGTWTSEQFLTHVVVDGDEVITGIKDVTNAYIGGNGGSGDATWELWNCFKVGKSNAGGTATLTLDSSIVFESIKVSAIGNRDDGTLTINGVTKNVTKKAIKGDLEPIELEYEIAGGISELTFSSKEASSGNYGICITKIEFVGGGTPTPQKQITGVELQGTLEKSSYIEGQTFDPSGLSLKVTYNEGDPDVLTSGFTFNVTNPLAVGEYDLKATYQGHTTDGSVHISVVAKELVSIAITHGMNQTTYQEDSDWNATGIVVQGTYNDGDVQTISSANYVLSYNPEKATGTGSVSVNIVATMSDGSGIKSEAFPQTVTVQKDPVTEPVLVDITIEGSLTKSDYKVGETYSAAGLSVLGHYDNESTKPLDVAITFNKTVAALGDTAIIASVEYEDLSDEKEFTVTVTKVDENIIDVSSVDSYSITSDGEGLPSSYGEGSNTNFAWTGLYKGQNDSIQGNSSKSSELHNVRAFSKEITYIKFNVGYAAGDAATGEVRFGSSAQPTGNAGKYGANTDYSLTELGSFVIFAPSSSTYLSVVWTKGASYFSSIDVHFDEYKEGGSAVDSVSLNKDSITLEAGSSETLVPTIAPSDAANKQVTWESSDEDIATVDSTGKVTAVAEGTATITVTTKDGGKTDTCSVTVTKASEGGSTAIDLGGDVSVVFGGVTYEKSLKAGSGKVAGSTAINVPSGAKKLIFYAAGWNGETVKISVTGGGISQTLSLTSDSGVSGNSPFTIGSTTEPNFKFEIDVSSLTGATTLTLAATSGNRFVVWNASYTK